MTEPHCVVLPLDGHREIRPDDNPWETVARGEGLMIRHSHPPDSGRAAWRTPLGPTSGLSRLLRKELGDVCGIGWVGFADAVRTAHLSNHLDSRRLVLVAAEAQFHNPGSPLHLLRQAVEADIAERARDLDRLHRVLSLLASTPLTISAWDGGVLPHLITDRAVENARTQARFAGLAAAVSDSPEPVGSMGFEAELSADGEVRILEPV